jgi:hypothetical protein
MVYATEAELEAIMLVPTTFFGAATPITTTMVTAILTQYSALLDGLTGNTEANFGTDTTCPEWVKQAVLATSAARIEAYYNNEAFTPEDAERVMKKYVHLRDTDLRPSFSQKIPSSVGSRDGTWQDQL